MANPQQPEVRRSEEVPALNPDAIESEIEARKTPGRGDSSDTDHQPPEQGHDDGDIADDPDRPDPDKVAEAFGVPTDGDDENSDDD